MSSEASPLTRRAVFAQAWPIMLGQASVPLVGLVDTVVIGRTGSDRVTSTFSAACG